MTAKHKKAQARARDAAFVNDLAKLPFVGMIAGRRVFWHNVKSTGNATEDEHIGSAYAYLALQFIKTHQFQPLLGFIAFSMIEKGCPPQIGVGFFQTIADVCLGIYKIPEPHVRLAVPESAHRVSRDT